MALASQGSVPALSQGVKWDGNRVGGLPRMGLLEVDVIPTTKVRLRQQVS